MTDGTQIIHWENHPEGKNASWAWAVTSRDGDLVAAFGTYQEALIWLDLAQAASEMEHEDSPPPAVVDIDD